MFNSLLRSTVFGIILPITMLTTFNAYAAPMDFSYTFTSNFIPGDFLPDGFPEDENWGPGATLSGRIDGTIDSLDPDRVMVNSFGRVVVSRPGLPVFEYDAIDASEFNAFPLVDEFGIGLMPVMSFSGERLWFRACPGGFNQDSDGNGVPDDCPFGLAPGGGFLVSNHPVRSNILATAADGTGASVCPDIRQLHGCRVADIKIRPFPEDPIFSGIWRLEVLPDGDRDSVPDADDNCPNTVIPESVPSRSLGVNRFALADGDAVFDSTSPNGNGSGRSYTIADTTGCSCTQIIEAQGLGNGHTKFGCSIGAMDNWVDLVN